MIKKQIKPVTAFANGKRVTATKLNVVSIKDDLFSQVTFKYTLFDETDAWAGESVFELNGRDEYSTWDASAEGAYTIVAAGIGVEFAPTTKAFFE